MTINLTGAAKDNDPLALTGEVEQALLRLLASFVAEHSEETSLLDFLMKELYSFVGESWEQEDDITLLTLRRSALTRS